MSKKTQPNRIAGFFIGVDPATQNDFYASFVHVLMEKPHREAGKSASEFKWIPYPVDILRIRKMDPNDMIDMQIKQLNRFPPTFLTIDSTREDFLSAALQKKYGSSRIIPMKYGNSGSTNTKFELKQLGFSYLNSGYEWPDISRLEQTQPRTAKLFRILKKEMMMEQVKFTETERITFSHPVGKHNDLVHAWEMSLHSVMEFQKKNLGNEKMKFSSPELGISLEQYYSKYEPPERNNAIYDTIMPNSAFRVP